MTAVNRNSSWYHRAGVRVTPRRVLGDELDRGQLFFSPTLIPYWDHPLVTALSPLRRSELLARHLYHYLEFTAQFEMRVVNRAVERIAGGRTGVTCSADTRLEAYQIYCDEGYHSLYSFDLIAQVSAATGIAPLPYDFEPFRRRLDLVGERVMPHESVLTQLLQVVVFETLISSILNDIPKDPRVLTAVRDIVHDHSRDEGRHHAFFSTFFKSLWGEQTQTARARIAQCLPDLIRASLSPDLRPVHAALMASGLDNESAKHVLSDSYVPARVTAGIRAASRHTVRLFEATGVFDVPGGQDAFEAAGLY